MSRPQDSKYYLSPKAHDNYSIMEHGKVKKIPSNVCNIINNQSCFDNGYDLCIVNRRERKDCIVLDLMCRGRNKVGSLSRATTNTTHSHAPDCIEGC